MTDIKKNGLYVGFFNGFSLLLPLILAPYASRILGPVGFGEIAYVQSMFIYFQLLSNLGAASYGQRLVAKVADDKQLLSVAFVEICVLKLVLGVLGIIVFLSSIHLFNLPLKLLLFVQVVHLVTSIFDISWFFYGIQEFKKVIFRQFWVKICTCVLVLVFVKSESDGFIYLLCFSVPALFAYLTLWLRITSYVSVSSFQNIRPFKHFKGLIMLFVPYASVVLFAHVDRFLLGSITGDMAEVGLYEMAFKFVAIVLGFATAISFVLMPNIASNMANGNQIQATQTFEKALELCLFLGILSSLSLFFVSPFLVPWFLGAKFSGAIPILQILSGVACLKAISIMIGSGLLIAIEREKNYSICLWLTLSVNILLNLIFIDRWGAIGAASSSLIAEGLLLLLLLYTSRQFISYKMMRTFFIYGFSAIPAILAVYCFFGNVETMADACIAVSIVLAVYMMTLFGVFRRHYIPYIIINFLARKSVG